MIIIGIDPGKDGGITKRNLETSLHESVIMPMLFMGKGSKRIYDEKAIKEYLKQTKSEGETIVYIEKQQAMPGQGVASMFSIGEGFGLLRGICLGLEIPFVIIGARTWQKDILRDMPGKGKHRAVIVMERLFPDMELKATQRCKVPHLGKVDSMAICEHGVRVQTRGGQNESS